MGIAKLKHIVSSKRVNVDKTEVISSILVQMICDIPVLCGKWNSHSNFIHTSQQINYSSVFDILFQPFRELFISECQHICRNPSSHYMQKHTFQYHYIKYILFCLLLDNFLVQV